MQTASLGMKDTSWFYYENKHYGILISNYRRIFTGINEKQDEAYLTKVIIEKNDIFLEKRYQIHHLPYGLFYLLFYLL